MLNAGSSHSKLSETSERSVSRSSDICPRNARIKPVRFSFSEPGACMQPRDFIKAFAVTAAFWSAAAQAQTYPSRPIVMVVPYAAGGTFDVMGRILAARMSELLN
jgi:hypothetical protein